jgi:dephospho-CoA kinase
MLRVGLTGGIGSGKTLVAEVFKSLSVPVFNANSAKLHAYGACFDNNRELI